MKSTGMQSLKGLLSASGVNMTGWTLAQAAVSADGSVIVGYGAGSSTQEAWLARFSPVFGNGLITPGVVAQSFAGQSALGQTGNAAIDNALGTFSEFATQAHASQDGRNTPCSVFAYGGYDSILVASGTFGVTMDLPNALVAGAAVSANYIETDMVYDGSAKMTGGSAGAFLARVPDYGLQWLVGVNGLTLKGDIDRGYLNGKPGAGHLAQPHRGLLLPIRPLRLAPYPGGIKTPAKATHHARYQGRQSLPGRPHLVLQTRRGCLI
jgi:hypothetical protein